MILELIIRQNKYKERFVSSNFLPPCNASSVQFRILTAFSSKCAVDKNGTMRTQKMTSVNTTAPALVCQLRMVTISFIYLTENSTIAEAGEKELFWKVIQILNRLQIWKSYKKSEVEKLYNSCDTSNEVNKHILLVRANN